MPDPVGGKLEPADEAAPMTDAQVSEAAEYYLESDNLPDGISEEDILRVKDAAEKLERERLHSPDPKLRPDLDDTL